MSPRKIPYVTLDVFTNERYKGNQLAVAYVGHESLQPRHMQLIAREFNFSETVFLHQNTDGVVVVDIYTPENEMDFAGHPIIGTGHVLFQQLFPGLANNIDVSSGIRLFTKAGQVVVHHDPKLGIVTAQVPHNIHIHSQPTQKDALLESQPGLGRRADLLEEGYPCISIVKGVTYTLVDLTKYPDMYASVAAGPSQVTTLDVGWEPSFRGVVYYQVVSDPSIDGEIIVQKLRIRMIAINLEDPACGSGSCALGSYLALQQGGPGRKFKFLLDQGREIKRDSNIIVDVQLNVTGTGVSKVFLSGPAAQVTEGTLLLPE